MLLLSQDAKLVENGIEILVNLSSHGVEGLLEVMLANEESCVNSKERLGSDVCSGFERIQELLHNQL